MDHNERQIIDELFGKLRRVDREAPPRDPEAEALIQRHLAGLPAAPYYMAQAIVVQERALAASQSRLRELEQQLAERPAGGFLSGLFGGGEEAGRSAGAPSARQTRAGPWGRTPACGGFLAGALQTALGVAGGFLIAEAITSAFAPDEAAAETLPEDLSAGEDLPDEDAGDLGEVGFDEF